MNTPTEDSGRSGRQRIDDIGDLFEQAKRDEQKPQIPAGLSPQVAR